MKKHHANWRTKSIQSIDRNDFEDIHHSSVISISAKDIKVVKEILTRAVEECKEVIRESPEEKIQVFNIDFFKL